MGVILLTVWIPPNKAVDLAKWYLKQKRELPYITKWRVFNTNGGLEGLKQYHLIYTEKGKLEEAGIELQKYFFPIANEMEGFRISSETLLGVSDSYALIGMKWEK
ncbi:MAG: hypothetical protein ACFFHV_11315 [Promethearchaeota archaeon]